MIYLDNAATSFPKPDSVREAILACMREAGGNPGRSSHRLARRASEVVFRTRQTLAELLGVGLSERIVFTANATEALNLAIKGILSPGDHVITTSLEHNAVVRPLHSLVRRGLELTTIRTNGGPIDPNEVRRAIKSNTRLLVTLFASNVTGTVMPVREIGEIARANEIPYLVDAAQAAGAVSINLAELPVDLLAFTGHKALLGPMGTGGLYIAEGIDIEPLKEGGTGSDSPSPLQPEALPDRFEAGTLNVPGIAGLGAAAQYILERGSDAIMREKLSLSHRLEEALCEIPRVRIHSVTGASKRIAITSMTVDGMDSQEVAYRFDRDFDICVRGGLHCAPDAHKSIGTFPEGTVRFSPGPFTTEENVDAAIKAVRRLATG
ncbi:MAG: aminotransferase class V-fold PLP-dependent enzyme [Candidatus Abyssobacteria bacterium SURF_17]|uniref:cysteine desulfurase n=1 Tax=Candidatus Abyssobacteria bacterium SURF_17 TaxID=2093361 RepID=A0A419ERM5_9BACT|nr:MAG: aminotransferase class V-fold PLP-dependent enzyme [Candidatus Abyssubacteria bacterium SURF_17]